MHDADAPPRLRWRVFVWGIAAVILLPVLYVAMVGPMDWWDEWHPGMPERFSFYYDTLSPLYESPEITTWIDEYREWWRDRPPLRSWRRARLAEEIETFKTGIRETSAAAQRWREQAGAIEPNGGVGIPRRDRPRLFSPPLRRR